MSIYKLTMLTLEIIQLQPRNLMT